MPFLFLKYLQPTHYFRLHTKSGLTIFPKSEKLPDHVKASLGLDLNYQSKLAQDYDLSWRAIQLGYIGSSEVYEVFEPQSVRDNYYFIRKHFHWAWVLFVLILRLVSLKNPIREFRAWFSTRKLKVTDAVFKPLEHWDWEQFHSDLIERKPMVSVIVPTLNRYDYLRQVLHDFEQQDYPHFELLVIDQSDDFNPDFYLDFNLDIKLIRQTEKALWLARNTGVKMAQGEFIALSEDDVRINRDWIYNHLKCLDFFKAQVSAGVFYPEGQVIPKGRSFFAIGSQFATGNAMLYKSIFKRVGLFDRQFEKQRMGDGEFGLRLYLEEIKTISNPKACCIDVKAGTGGLREMGSWDAFRPSSFFAPRPIPSVLYYFRRYYGDVAAKMALLRMVPLSLFPYQFKKNKPLMVVGLIATILLLPIICFQVLKSWHLASKKLRKGPLIESL
ncbi:glycosyl transferase family 2 [Hanstruepera neustonica]|uniref:Glycosyl transferase family 2 n=1 Tax=Hanstruepera neustonica TaxID=1445657 RepID=A0A2K1DVQ6_9FLAO|nr:glycosyltransferase family A protein [Hanstruepera neustonica]PNQ72093.1 glycosyl transferase family 2 [Hanstruepera neustonica]